MRLHDGVIREVCPIVIIKTEISLKMYLAK